MSRFHKKEKKKKTQTYNENIKIDGQGSQRGSCTVDYPRRSYMKWGILFMLVSLFLPGTSVLSKITALELLL